MASSYLQRIVGRMGTLPLPAAPALPLPDALLMPLFDPFVEAEPPDDLPAPAPVAPASVAVPPPPPPAYDAQTVIPPAEPSSRTIMEVRTSPSLEVHVHDDPVAPPPEHPVHPAEVASTPDAPPTVVWRTETFEHETQEQISYVVPEPQERDPDVVERTVFVSAPPLPPSYQQPPLDFEAMTVDAEPRTNALQPPDEPDPPVAPPLDAGPAQITIGDIVVEVVARPEPPRQMAAPQQARRVQPSAVPATRTGVRSKRGFGIDQM